MWLKPVDIKVFNWKDTGCGVLGILDTVFGMVHLVLGILDSDFGIWYFGYEVYFVFGIL